MVWNLMSLGFSFNSTPAPFFSFVIHTLYIIHYTRCFFTGPAPKSVENDPFLLCYRISSVLESSFFSCYRIKLDANAFKCNCKSEWGSDGRGRTLIMKLFQLINLCGISYGVVQLLHLKCQIDIFLGGTC